MLNRFTSLPSLLIRSSRDLIIFFFLVHLERHSYNGDFPYKCKCFLCPWYMCAKLLQSCLTLCDPMDYNPPSSSVHGILQARILEWVAMSSFRNLPDTGIKTASSLSSVEAVRFFTTSSKKNQGHPSGAAGDGSKIPSDIKIWGCPSVT